MQTSHSFSDEEIKLLGKFGFQVNGNIISHKKMEIEKRVEDFQGFASLNQLEEYIKSLLRSC